MSQVGEKEKDAKKLQVIRISLCEKWTWRSNSTKILISIFQNIKQRNQWN